MPILLTATARESKVKYCRKLNEFIPLLPAPKARNVKAGASDEGAAPLDDVEMSYQP
jgi:hypothetical protein